MSKNASSRSVSTVVFGLTLWPWIASAECTKDIECKGDRVCDQGQCISPKPSLEAQAPPNVIPSSTAVASPTSVESAPSAIRQPVQTPVFFVTSAPNWRYANSTMRSWGIGLFVVGLVADTAGTTTYLAGANYNAQHSDAYNQGADSAEQAGAGLWISGGILTLAGIVLWTVGGSVVSGSEHAYTVPKTSAWLDHVVPYVSTTRSGTRAGFSADF